MGRHINFICAEFIIQTDNNGEMMGLNIMQLVLSIFRESFLHLTTAWCYLAHYSWGVFELRINVVSSAHKIEERTCDIEAISLMYTKNDNFELIYNHDNNNNDNDNDDDNNKMFW